MNLLINDTVPEAGRTGKLQANNHLFFVFFKTTICLTNLTFTFHTKTRLMLHVSGVQRVIC